MSWAPIISSNNQLQLLFKLVSELLSNSFMMLLFTKELPKKFSLCYYPNFECITSYKYGKLHAYSSFRFQIGYRSAPVISLNSSVHLLNFRKLMHNLEFCMSMWVFYSRKCLDMDLEILKEYNKISLHLVGRSSSTQFLNDPLQISWMTERDEIWMNQSVFPNPKILQFTKCMILMSSDLIFLDYSVEIPFILFDR